MPVFRVFSVPPYQLGSCCKADTTARSTQALACGDTGSQHYFAAAISTTKRCRVAACLQSRTPATLHWHRTVDVYGTDMTYQHCLHFPFLNSVLQHVTMGTDGPTVTQPQHPFLHTAHKHYWQCNSGPQQGPVLSAPCLARMMQHTRCNHGACNRRQRPPADAAKACGLFAGHTCDACSSKQAECAVLTSCMHTCQSVKLDLPLHQES